MNHYSDFSEFFPCGGIKAGISLKQFQYFPPEDRKKIVSLFELNPEQIVIPVQTHSNNVVICTKSGGISNTDGMITIEKLVLTIQVADCIPIYLVDPVAKIIGLHHAGWRGIANGIVLNGIQKLIQLNSNPQNVIVFLGPSIRQCCFEVSLDVALEFDSSFVRNTRKGERMINLQGIVRSQLTDSGVNQKNIIDINECTFCFGEKYHSFRREGKSAGRMIAILGWK